MATTNYDLITGALQLLGVVAETEQTSAEQGDLGLAVLNDMLEAWAEDDIDVGQYPQTDLAAEWPGSPGTVGTVKSNLALYLAPHYQREPSPLVVAMASAGYQKLVRDLVSGQLQPLDMSHLHRGDGESDGTDILTGQ